MENHMADVEYPPRLLELYMPKVTALNRHTKSSA